ncbi:MAG TPA: HAMP domain-containing sensor histidine kinase [Candidatus Saccharimonadales bacterium]|nr:HAMP domain-containing sensor histidine kinase [Candidatus Saccharimonadales bacterium]
MARLHNLVKYVFAEAPIMIAILTGPEHKLSFANSLFLQTIGTTKRKVIGTRLGDALPELKDLEMHWDTVYRTGVPHLDHERHLRLDYGNGEGEDVYFNFVYQPIKDRKGRTEAICVYAMEVTTQVRARKRYSRQRQRLLNQQTAQLKSQNTELKELNKSKDEFIALASHQLRTPATGVKQYLGMILEGYVGPMLPAQEEFIVQAYESNERQLSTINDLLQIAQIDANKIVLDAVACDVTSLVKAVAKEQRGNIERRRQAIAMHQEGREKVTAWADPLRLRMVLDNLVDNASKYSRENTTITITVHATEKEAVIQVTDQGIGIAERDFARLFQKFSRIDNPLSIVVGGNGLGLYLAKKIIDAHKGKIDVSSVLHQGTTFTIRLPRPKEV